MVDSEPTTECDFLDLDIFLDPRDLNSDMNPTHQTYHHQFTVLCSGTTFLSASSPLSSESFSLKTVGVA